MAGTSFTEIKFKKKTTDVLVTWRISVLLTAQKTRNPLVNQEKKRYRKEIDKMPVIIVLLLPVCILDEILY
jgi:hypothetical protein